MPNEAHLSYTSLWPDLTVFALSLFPPVLLAVYLRYDSTMAMAITQFKVASTLACLCLIPLPIFAIYIDYMTYVKRYNYIWRPIHELVVVNPARFFELNPTLAPPSIQENAPLRSVISMLRSLASLYHAPKSITRTVRFYRKQLLYFPANLSAKIRLRALVINWLFRFVVSGTYVVVSKCNATVFSIH